MTSKADKENSVIIMKRNDYHQVLLNILLVLNKFVKEWIWIERIQLEFF